MISVETLLGQSELLADSGSWDCVWRIATMLSTDIRIINAQDAFIVWRYLN